MAENPDDSSSDRLLVDGILGIDVSTLVSMETFDEDGKYTTCNRPSLSKHWLVDLED